MSEDDREAARKIVHAWLHYPITRDEQIIGITNMLAAARAQGMREERNSLQPLIDTAKRWRLYQDDDSELALVRAIDRALAAPAPQEEKNND